MYSLLSIDFSHGWKFLIIKADTLKKLRAKIPIHVKQVENHVYRGKLHFLFPLGWKEIKTVFRFFE